MKYKSMGKIRKQTTEDSDLNSLNQISVQFNQDLAKVDQLIRNLGQKSGLFKKIIGPKMTTFKKWSRSYFKVITVRLQENDEHFANRQLQSQLTIWYG